MTGIAVQYGDVAPGAKENFVPTCPGKAEFDDILQLNEYNLNCRNFANPCEQYRTILDGAQEAFPDDAESENFGLISESISGADGSFSTPVVLTLTSEGQYSSQGFTLTFDKDNNIFATSVTIDWYQGDTLLDTQSFTPNSAFYFCRNKVDFFSKVVMTFSSMNMPYNRLRLQSVDYGYGTVFYGDELTSAKMIQEIDPISSEISINTFDFTLESKSDISYSFQRKQPINVYFNDKLLSTNFVVSAKRKGERTYEIKSEDYISVLETTQFKGGMYFGADAETLLEAISTVSKVPFDINIEEATVTGYIPICSCREALMQICFACGVVCDTSGSTKVKVYSLTDTVSQTIPLERISQGQSFTDSDRVTEVRLTAHSYKTSADSAELYSYADSGAGENILVEFGSPMANLTITHGTIVESNCNYAIINASVNCVLTGYEYIDTTTVLTRRNPNVLSSDLENVVSVDNATLISPSNAAVVLAHIYEHLSKVSTVSLSVIEGKDPVTYGVCLFGAVKYGGTVNQSVVSVGDIITCETAYLGNLTGRVISERYSLGGGILTKECEMI